MYLAESATLLTLVTGLFIGIVALGLVANELGKHAGLSFGARFALAGGLGMGVLATGIKVLVISALSQTGGQAMVVAGVKARAAVNGVFSEAESEVEEGIVSSVSSGLRTWRPLPASAPDPRGNRSTLYKVELGRKLFNDKGLSLDRSLSCASCHLLKEGGDDGVSYSVGVGGQVGNRNAPTVLNAGFLTRLFWDGRAASLEKQAEQPFVNPVEMAMPSLEAVENRVREKPEYQAFFEKAFGEDAEIDIRNITRAIAAYERSLITPDTPFDRFVRGENGVLSVSSLRGMALFDAVGCRSCHMDPVFSAAGTEKPFGVYRSFPIYREDNPFLAKYDLLIDGEPSRFRVPSLRNVELTAPYFHNGSVDNLEEAIRIMAVSQLDRTLSDDPADDIRIATRVVEEDEPGRNLTMFRDRALSSAEIADLAAFLRSLTAYSLPE